MASIVNNVRATKRKNDQIKWHNWNNYKIRMITNMNIVHIDLIIIDNKQFVL